MNSEVYEIVLHSPIGPKKGRLILFREGNQHSADIYLMEHSNHFAVVLTGMKEYRLIGSLWTLMGDIACTIKVKINGGILTAVADTVKGIMALDGSLIQKEAL